MFLIKRIPKKGLRPHREQLIRGSAAEVKDRCNAVTRGCVKKHVCASYCEMAKGKRKCAIQKSSKNGVNIETSKTQRLIVNAILKNNGINIRLV
jgi:hypothetical protein